MPAEIEPALERVRRLVVQQAREERLALEDELAGEKDRRRKIAHRFVAELLQLREEVDAQREARFGVPAERVRELDQALHILFLRLLEIVDLARAFEAARVDDADGDEDNVLKVDRK